MTNADGWSVGEIPWVRDALTGAAERSRSYAQCYFCGEMTAMISANDLASDTGRVEVYCNNTRCEAREMTVLVSRDGSKASSRADVRILKSIDEDTRSSAPPPWTPIPLGQIVEGSDKQSLSRRLDGGPVSYAAPGVE